MEIGFFTTKRKRKKEKKEEEKLWWRVDNEKVRKKEKEGEKPFLSFSPSPPPSSTHIASRTKGGKGRDRMSGGVRRYRK